MTELISFSRKQLNDSSLIPDYRIAVMGDCATQHLSAAVRGFCYAEGKPVELLDCDYNQIEFQVFDKDSELYRFSPNVVLIFMCVQKLYLKYCEFNQKDEFAQSIMERIKEIHQRINSISGASVLQFTFAEENDCIYGNFGLKTRESFVFQVHKLNMLLMATPHNHLKAKRL